MGPGGPGSPLLPVSPFRPSIPGVPGSQERGKGERVVGRGGGCISVV